MIGDSYAPKPGQRVILWMKPAREGYDGDRLEGTVISLVSWADCDCQPDVSHDDCPHDVRLRVNLRTSWEAGITVPLDRVRMVTNLDAHEASEAAYAARTQTYSEWLADRARIDVELVRPALTTSRDEEFEREKDDMLGKRS